MGGQYRKGYVISDQAAIHFLTMTVVEWLEIFIRPQLADICLDNLRYCTQNKGLDIHAWCLMPNHLYLLCSHSEGNLSGVLRDFKAFTAKAIYQNLSTGQVPESRKQLLLNRFQFAGKPFQQEFKLWQPGSHPIICFSRDFLEQKLAYIHGNPVKAGFVREPEHYRYSSAYDYQGGEGLLPLVPV